MLISRNVHSYVLVEYGKVIKIILNFGTHKVIAQDEIGRIIFRRRDLDNQHMIKVKESIECAIKIKKVTI